jgi:uncharacterized protein
MPAASRTPALDPRAPLVLDTSELSRRPGAMRRASLTVPPPAGLGVAIVRLDENADLQLDLRLESVLEGVLVSGIVRGHYTGECVRCLEAVEGDVTADLQELFVYPDVEREQSDDGDEEPRLVGTLLDMEPVVRDALVLALPLQPVCREDCRGLCPECGTRLADDPDHRHDRIDPRWAALQDALPSVSQGSTPQEK